MKKQILTILKGIGEDADFESSIDFFKDGLIDSFGIMALIGAIEEEFHVEIDGGDILPENFVNLEAIVNMVTKTLECEEE